MVESWITLAAFEVKEAIGDSGETPKPHTTHDLAEIIERRFRASHNWDAKTVQDFILKWTSEHKFSLVSQAPSIREIEKALAEASAQGTAKVETEAE